MVLFLHWFRPCVCVCVCVCIRREATRTIGHKSRYHCWYPPLSGTSISRSSSHVINTKHGIRCFVRICQSSTWFAAAINGRWHQFTVHSGRIYECSHCAVELASPTNLWANGSGPLSNTWFLPLTRVHIPNGISIGSAVFAQLTVATDRQRACSNT